MFTISLFSSSLIVSHPMYFKKSVINWSLAFIKASHFLDFQSRSLVHQTTHAPAQANICRQGLAKAFSVAQTFSYHCNLYLFLSIILFILPSCTPSTWESLPHSPTEECSYGDTCIFHLYTALLFFIAYIAEWKKIMYSLSWLLTSPMYQDEP